MDWKYMTTTCNEQGLGQALEIPDLGFEEGDLQEYPHAWVESHSVPMLGPDSYLIFYFWREREQNGEKFWELALDPEREGWNIGSNLLQLWRQMAEDEEQYGELDDTVAGQISWEQIQKWMEINETQVTIKAPPWERTRIDFAEKMEALMGKEEE